MLRISNKDFKKIFLGDFHGGFGSNRLIDIKQEHLYTPCIIVYASIIYKGILIYYKLITFQVLNLFRNTAMFCNQKIDVGVYNHNDR